ncbi:MAG: diphthine synthase [Candidatus Diapherotrites archaeon]
MLYIVGIGLKPQHISLEAIEALKRCGNVFIDSYTSVYAEGSVQELEKILGRSVVQLGREQLEGGGISDIINTARSNTVALCVFGNPLSATTHIQLLIDAKKAGVRCEVIPGISTFSFLGKTGIDEYRFGRTVTIVRPEKGYAPDSFFTAIEKNRSAGMHTLCLLDIKSEWQHGRMIHDCMGVREAISILAAIAKKRKSALMRGCTFIGISCAGSENEKIRAGSAQELSEFDFGVPAALIVCAKLNEKETEALGVFYGWNKK